MLLEQTPGQSPAAAPPLLPPTIEALQRIRRRYAPPPRLTISDFSDRTIVVTSGPLSGTRWQTDFAPYQRGILNAWDEPGVQIIVVMGSSQWGKTACAVNVVSYHMAHDPCAILIVMPTLTPMARRFVKNRLEPTINASPELRAVIDRRQSPGASNSVFMKTFRSGFVAVTGSNSAASLASDPIRLLVLDEVDRYKAELKGEGSTIAVVMKRTTAFSSRRRVFMTSSPTFRGGAIHSWFQLGDQRKFHVPCPGCGEFHAYEWRNVKFEDHDPNTARLECPACKYRISEAERVALLTRGEWRAEHPERTDASIVSFHVWEAYSPLSSLAEIVKGFLRARTLQKAGDRAEMHTWQNLTLGEPTEPDFGDGVEPHALLLRREAYDGEIDCPEGVAVLTAGIDTQDDRLEGLVLGWGPGEECWIVDRFVEHGDPDQPEVWARVDELLDHGFLHATGQRLVIQAACIDSAGHKTNAVYAYCATRAARRVFCIIGRDGQRPIVSSPSPRRWGRNERQVALYTIGTDAAKALVVSRLNLTEKGHGYVHLPHADWCDEELAAQLTSERLVKKFTKGLPAFKWTKRRTRNEGLDAFVYGLGALRLLNPDLSLALQRLKEPPPVTPPPATPKAGWLGPRRPGGWLRGGRR